MISDRPVVVEVLLTDDAEVHFIDAVVADEMMFRAGVHIKASQLCVDVRKAWKFVTDRAVHVLVKFEIRIVRSRQFLLQKRDLFGGQISRVRF